MQHLITEQYLKQGLFKHELHKRVAFIEIDLVKSASNPARMERRLDQDRAIGYALAMEQGVEFPAIVLLNHEQPHGRVKFEVATGMHRIEAAKLARRDYFDAYIVTEPDKYRREVLIRQLNTLEGRGVTQNEKILHVLWLHENFPTKSLSQLAKEWNLKPNTVQQAAQEVRARIRARRFNYDFERAKVPQKAAVALDRIHSDKVYEKVLELYMIVGQIQTADVLQIVDEIRQARDERTAFEIVNRWREIAEQRATVDKAKRVRVSPSAMSRFLGDVRRCNRHFDKPITELHASQLLPRDLILAIAQVAELQSHLKTIQVELDRITKTSQPQRPAA